MLTQLHNSDILIFKLSIQIKINSFLIFVNKLKKIYHKGNFFHQNTTLTLGATMQTLFLC